MDIAIYFDPVSVPDFDFQQQQSSRLFGGRFRSYLEKGQFPDLQGVDLVILGVGEDRASVLNEGCANGADVVRKHLYSLHNGDFQPHVADLGNIRRGHHINDTFYALTAVVAQLIENNITPLILGGSQDLTYANYRAYESLGQVINILAADPMFDLGDSEEALNSRSYLNKIILHQPNFLFNYTNIGYQTYLVDPESVNLMKNLYFDVYRLGKIRENMQEVEPLTRNADLFTFDVSSIRQSDAPGCKTANPNGFFGEEACRIMRYAGMSDKLSSLGIYEYNPTCDPTGQTANLIAQMLWYFIEGYYHRKNDHPHRDKSDFVKYTVSIKDHKDQLVFYKSKKSDRWWMDVPVRKNLQNIYERHHLVPCSYQDYEIACKDDIPDRWWQAYQKLM